MKWDDYLAPVSGRLLETFQDKFPQRLGASVLFHDEIEGVPELNGVKLALVAVHEDRGSLQNKGCDTGADKIREELYKLYLGNWAEHTIVDMGTLYKGEDLKDTQAALQLVLEELLRLQIVPIVFGGSNDLVYACYRSLHIFEQMINIAGIDPRFDLGEQHLSLNDENYLSHIVLQKPYMLNNLSCIGYQSYFVAHGENALRYI